MNSNESKLFRPSDVLEAYRLYQKMMRYPQLVDEMRCTFVGALEERGIVDLKTLESEAREQMREHDVPEDQAHFKEYVDLLTDFYFARHFTENEKENYINLARKKDRFRHLYRVINSDGATYGKIKRALRDFCEIPQGDVFISPNEAEGARVALINYFISNQLPFISIAKKHITIRDIDEMLENTYWNRRRTGKIGGKAAGLLLAHKILLPRLVKCDEELEKYIRVPESYYFHSGIFSDFIDFNGLHWFHTQKYKSREEIEEEYKNIAGVFERASFPPDVIDDFRGFLEKVGEHPLVLRSSSFLEDNFGFAFSGKYDSVFLVNQGDLETRLQHFMRGLKRVHMSTFGPSPILYRKDHNLLDFDEKMGVLVQKVVGRWLGDYFFPLAAGVAFSYNSYSWTPRIKKEDGVVRLVFGLGTRAVDRLGSDYTRMIPLSHPTLRPEIGSQQITKYSQKMADCLNFGTGGLESFPCARLFKETEHPDLYYVVSVQEDGDLHPPMFKTRKISLDRACVTFDNLIRKTQFVALMKKVLSKLQEAYGRPVDVEFAWEEGKLYIVQCRSLSVSTEEDEVELPEDVPDERVIFTSHRVMSSCSVRDIETIIYVDPKAYAGLASYEDKALIGRVVSRLNRALEGKRYALLGPGRWGSNDINLGVRVAYEDINHTLVLGEIAFQQGESTPDVSYGTHFFNDLVEARIASVAIFPDEPGSLFREDFFLEARNDLASLAPAYAGHADVVRVIHVPEASKGLYLHILQDSQSQRSMGFLGEAVRH